MSSTEDPSGSRSKGIRPWSTISEQLHFDRGGLLRLFERKVEAAGMYGGPDQRSVVVLESHDWVNVIPVLGSGDDKQLVFIRQWRFGAERSTLEIPGGLVDEGESHLQAARRELREETGYVAQGWIRLGEVSPNPALFSNRCATFLATELELVDPVPQGDGDEELEIVRIEADRLDQLVRQGEIDHALVLAAFHHWTLHQQTERD